MSKIFICILTLLLGWVQHNTVGMLLICTYIIKITSHLKKTTLGATDGVDLYSNIMGSRSVGGCFTKNLDRNKVIQFCSGSYITGNNITLSTEDASTRITNCTCFFTTTQTTAVDIYGDCSNKIYIGFLFSYPTLSNACAAHLVGNVETTRVLQSVYINDDNNGKTYCKQLRAHEGELQGACFADSFNPTTTEMFSTTVPISSSTNEHSSTNRDRTESTTSSTTVKGSSTDPIKVFSTTVPISSSTNEHSSTNRDRFESTSSTVKVNSTDINTTISLTTKNQDDSKLLIVILASVLAIVSTLLIISVVFLVRNRRVKKEENGPPNVPSNYVSFDRTENIDYETVYTELQ